MNLHKAINDFELRHALSHVEISTTEKPKDLTWLSHEPDSDGWVRPIYGLMPDSEKVWTTDEGHILFYARPYVLIHQGSWGQICS
jgi:hypothetical protein